MEEAIKYDSGKTRLELIPEGALEEVGKVFTYGAYKYEVDNWAKGEGLAYSRLYGAMRRHMSAFYQRKDFDEETKLEHLAHSVCCGLMLLQLKLSGIGIDDRPSYKPLKK